MFFWNLNDRIKKCLWIATKWIIPLIFTKRKMAIHVGNHLRFLGVADTIYIGYHCILLTICRSHGNPTLADHKIKNQRYTHMLDYCFYMLWKYYVKLFIIFINLINRTWLYHHLNIIFIVEEMMYFFRKILKMLLSRMRSFHPNKLRVMTPAHNARTHRCSPEQT